MKWKIAAVAAALALRFVMTSLAANAQTPDCKSAPALPSDTLTSANQPAALGSATLTPGHPVTVTLHPSAKVAYAMPPEKSGTDVSYGGLLGASVSDAATYAVSLGSGGWIDMVKDGAPVASTVHGHGDACSVFRKMVSFPLNAGRYVIQISANPAATVAVMVSKVSTP